MLCLSGLSLGIQHGFGGILGRYIWVFCTFEFACIINLKSSLRALHAKIS